MNIPVDNADYPSNSKMPVKKLEGEKTPEKEKPEPVVTGEVRRKKKGLGKKIAETFTGDDARSVGEYILFEVMIPAAKNTISDAVSQGVERMLFGDIRRRPNGGPRYSGPRTSYTNYSTRNSSSLRAFEPDGPTQRRDPSRRARAVHDFDEIILSSRGEAEIVIERLSDLVDTYGVATVTDLYNLLGITGSYTDDKWGWYNLRDAGFTRIRNGYLLDLPPTSAID